MDLETFWFVLIAVLWAGYFALEGFDFGVGMLLPWVGRDDDERSHDAEDDRAGLGRERGLARRRRRRDVRGVPRLVRDDVLGLLRRAPARPLLPHHPRRLVRVAVEERERGLAGVLDVVQHDRQRRGRARVGHRALEPRVRRPDRLRRQLRRGSRGSLQPVHGLRRHRGRAPVRVPRCDVPDASNGRRRCTIAPDTRRGDLRYRRRSSPPSSSCGRWPWPSTETTRTSSRLRCRPPSGSWRCCSRSSSCVAGAPGGRSR